MKTPKSITVTLTVRIAPEYGSGVVPAVMRNLSESMTDLPTDIESANLDIFVEHEEVIIP